MSECEDCSSEAMPTNKWCYRCFKKHEAKWKEDEAREKEKYSHSGKNKCIDPRGYVWYRCDGCGHSTDVEMEAAGVTGFAPTFKANTNFKEVVETGEVYCRSCLEKRNRCRSCAGKLDGATNRYGGRGLCISCEVWSQNNFKSIFGKR